MAFSAVSFVVFSTLGVFVATATPFSRSTKDASNTVVPSHRFHIPLRTKALNLAVNFTPYGRMLGAPVEARKEFLVGTISVGTPRQELEVLFDLGSPEMVLPSTDTTRNHCDKYHCFNGTASSTYNSTGTYHSESYGAGDDDGVIALDEVQIGDVVVSKQAFLDCHTMTRAETKPNWVFHGVVGLSYRMDYDPIEDYSPPFVYHAKAQGKTKKEQLSILYPRGNKEGELTIGGWNENLVSEEKIRWFENAKFNALGASVFWGISDIKNISVEAGTNKFGWPLGEGLVMDSGAPIFLMLPSFFFEEINKVFIACGYDLSAHHNTIKMSEIDKLPTFTFDVQGHKFSMTPSQYVIPAENSMLSNNPSHVHEELGTVPILENDETSMAGGVFLKNFYSVFDYENQRVGLVPLAEING